MPTCLRKRQCTISNSSTLDSVVRGDGTNLLHTLPLLSAPDSQADRVDSHNPITMLTAVLRFLLVSIKMYVVLFMSAWWWATYKAHIAHTGCCNSLLCPPMVAASR